MDYTPNSNRFKEEKKAAETEKRAQKVVSAPVTVRPKTGARKFAEVFLARDVATVKQHIRDEVLLPGAKDLIWSIFTNALELFLFKDDPRRNKSKDRFSSEFITYSNFSKKGSNHNAPSYKTASSGFNFDDIVFENRGDAEMVLSSMRALISKYGVVRVADLYDLIDRSAPYTSVKYGWCNLDNATSNRERNGGYTLDLPKAMSLDD